MELNSEEKIHHFPDIAGILQWFFKLNFYILTCFCSVLCALFIFMEAALGHLPDPGPNMSGLNSVSFLFFFF